MRSALSRPDGSHVMRSALSHVLWVVACNQPCIGPVMSQTLKIVCGSYVSDGVTLTWLKL